MPKKNPTPTTKTVLGEPSQFKEIPSYLCNIDGGKSQMAICDAREVLSKIVKHGVNQMEVQGTSSMSSILKIIQQRILEQYIKKKKKKPFALQMKEWFR